MAVSQNGWPANDRSLVASRLVPGTQVRVTVRTDAAGDVLLWVASQFDLRVEDIDNARGALDDWGYAERPIRGGRALSNHASGTAIDLNATRHPLGARGTFSLVQVGEIHRILDEVDNVVRWGGDYRGRKDEMHFEISAGPDVVARVAARLEDNDMLRIGSPRTDDVKKLQFKLNAVGATDGDGKPLVVDGVFGPRTSQAVEAFQQANGLTVDGAASDLTLAQLWAVAHGLTQHA